MSVSRRGFLRTVGIASTSAGCLDQGPDPYAEAVEEIPSDPSGTDRSTSVGGVHWFPPDSFGSMVDRLDPTGVQLAWERFDERRSLEVAVADRMVAARPPDLIQTALGAELRQYAFVSAIDPVPSSLLEDSALENVAEMCTIDGESYAVPVSWMPTNVMAVDPEIGEIHHSDVIEAARRLGQVGMRRTPGAIFHLFCLCVLATGGRKGYRAIETGDITRTAVTEAVEAVVAISTDIRWLSPHPTPDEIARCTAFIVDPITIRILEQNHWHVHPFPGTRGTVPIHATGLARPSRTRKPHGALRALEASVVPAVQRDIAARAGHLPVTAPSPDDVALAGMARTAEHLLPAVSTGCGLDPDRRWHAMARLHPSDIERDGLTTQLSEILG